GRAASSLDDPRLSRRALQCHLDNCHWLDPTERQGLVETMVQVYLEGEEHARSANIERASSWLTQRLAALRTDLKAAEDAVEAFRREHNLLATRTGSLTEQQLAEINLQLIEARTELAERRAAYRQAEALLASGRDIYALPAVIYAD